MHSNEDPTQPKIKKNLLAPQDNERKMMATGQKDTETKLKGLLLAKSGTIWATKINDTGISLVAQWLRTGLPMQGTRVRALVWEDPTCCGATNPVCHNYWACALEPVSHNYRSLRATTTEARAPRARAPLQEKPPQWEACTPQWRVAPAHCN